MTVNKQVCYDCGAKCCQSVILPINKEEPAAEIFLDKYAEDELPEGHQMWDDEDTRENNWRYESNREPCMFLDQEKLICLIENKKPVICKTYPLKWKNAFNYFISLRCPLTHHIPLKEIFSWAKPFHRIIADINLYNDFDQNDTEKFIGIRRLENRFDLGIYENGLKRDENNV